MLWFALFLSFSRSRMLVTPVLAAIFHLLRLGQAVTSTTALASLRTTKCREVFLQAKSSGVTVTMVSVFPWCPPLQEASPHLARGSWAAFPSRHLSRPVGAGLTLSGLSLLHIPWPSLGKTLRAGKLTTQPLETPSSGLLLC